MASPSAVLIAKPTPRIEAAANDPTAGLGRAQEVERQIVVASPVGYGRGWACYPSTSGTWARRSIWRCQRWRSPAEEQAVDDRAARAEPSERPDGVDDVAGALERISQTRRREPAQVRCVERPVAAELPAAAQEHDDDLAVGHVRRAGEDARAGPEQRAQPLQYRPGVAQVLEHLAQDERVE